MAKKNHIDNCYCASMTEYSRRGSSEVRIGGITIGGRNPVAIQSMTDADTNDTQACVEQIGRIRDAGCRIVRLAVQGVREGENLKNIACEVKRRWPDVALVADVHFLPEVAMIAAEYVDKVRINPGNYHDKGGDFDLLLNKCKERGVALRIGVNHGSLAPYIVEEYGDTPLGMVKSAMQFLEKCRNKNFDQVVVSMKSSNTRVMVHAYRMLIAEMSRAGMNFPIHLGVTEAGNGADGRIKSAAGIGALLTDGIGDTIRVSLTEPPENEIPVAERLVEYFAGRCKNTNHENNSLADICLQENLFNPCQYSRRETRRVGRVGGGELPLLYSELNAEEKAAVEEGRIAVVSANGDNAAGLWRTEISKMNSVADRRPIILYRKYDDCDLETLISKAAADFGVMFIDGLGDGIWLEGPDNITQAELNDISLNILQAARARMSKTEFIACPGCGRTLFDLQGTLRKIKESTSHLKDLKIGVMGCIVNGPGEMADADYGYVGSGPGLITLYRGKSPVRKNIPQESALGELIAIIRSDGKWIEP